jgi:hypothetical protein
VFLAIFGTVVTVVSVGYAIYSDIKRRSERDWIHMALVNLKPGIEEENRNEVITAINNMLEGLKAPRY